MLNKASFVYLLDFQIYYSMEMKGPQEEAIGILKAVSDRLLTGNADLKAMLRSCFHACQLLDWHKQLTWFDRELHGYPPEVALPWYRQDIKGHTEWLTRGGIYKTVASVVQNQFRGDADKEPTTHVTMDIGGGVDWILMVAQVGYIESTGNKSSKYLRTLQEQVEVDEVCVYDKQVFQTMLTHIENKVFDFASKSYVVLRYSDALGDVWRGYQTRVDESLLSTRLKEQLDTVRTGLSSDNPQSWRDAVWSCRDIIHDLATYLWQDPRDEYEHLPGKGQGGKLSVTENNYVNRLGAYLHQKQVAGETRAYLHAEMERIYHSIQTLNKLANKAHSGISLSDARTVAIGTYMILGELVTRTDMKPVTRYQSP